ncbi:MAG: BCD family MFS transporter, partial [Anaerolineae bacterium]|nr:BCD family MFS transporter [Anaerolineae bacterium]
MTELHEPNLTLGRNLKIGLFHLGSGMADVVTTGIWNRIMISDLGFSATPVSLLISLKYFLAPLGVWAGRMSDRHAIGGYRRLFWIWLGRMMMAIGTATLGVSTAYVARGSEATPAIWAVFAVSMLLFSLGSALSGGTFLALIYDRSSAKQHGRAVGIVWTFLLVGFTFAGILFGVMLPSNHEPVAEGTQQLSFTPDTLQNLFVMGALLMAGLWFISLVGEERRGKAILEAHAESKRTTSIWADLKQVWSNRQTRSFFWFLGLSMLFAFAQDPILEPFAGDVFKMDAAHTTRFAAYWGSMAIISTVIFIWLGRKYSRLTNTLMSYVGVGVLVAAFAIFGISGLAQIRGLVTIGLIVLGVGLGIWNVGTLGMMMEMSPSGRAGTFLGFWTLVVTMFRGLGTSGAGITLDIMKAVTGTNLPVSYGVIFVA